MLYRWIVILFSLLAVSCTSSTPKLIVDKSIPIYRKEIPVDVFAEPFGELEAEHGYGCGGFGASGTYEGATAVMQNQAALNNADAVLITREVPPRLVTGCRDNTFYLTGTLLRFNSFTYTPPKPLKLESMEFRYILPAPYDQAWASLIDAVSSQFFEIINYEKASGLLTLSYDADNASEYIDCGQWLKTNPEKINVFEGSYLDWLSKGKEFSTKMNINLRVRRQTETSTVVEINASYKVRAPQSRIAFNFITRKQAVKYSEQAVKGMDSTRICQSTLKLEELLQSTIRTIAQGM